MKNRTFFRWLGSLRRVAAARTVRLERTDRWMSRHKPVLAFDAFIEFPAVCVDARRVLFSGFDAECCSSGATGASVQLQGDD